MRVTRKSSHFMAVLRRVQQTAFLAGYKEQARRDRLEADWVITIRQEELEPTGGHTDVLRDRWHCAQFSG